LLQPIFEDGGRSGFSRNDNCLVPLLERIGDEAKKTCKTSIQEILDFFNQCLNSAPCFKDLFAPVANSFQVFSNINIKNCYVLPLMNLPFCRHVFTILARKKCICKHSVQWKTELRNYSCAIISASWNCFSITQYTIYSTTETCT